MEIRSTWHDACGDASGTYGGEAMLRILIVEDEDIIRKGLVYMMDWLSMDCVVAAEAANGKEGYEKILEYRPDVVLTDIYMPYMDGIDMIQKASETVKFKSVLLTSYADFDYAKRAIEARVSEYLLKPVDEAELARLMKRLEREIASSRQAEYVMEQAIALLNTRKYRVSEISDATGFSDYKHFCSVFKKYTSKAPAKFMKGI